MLPRIARFARYCFWLTEGQALLALLFLVLSTLTEGVAILLLVPMLQLVGPAGGAGQAAPFLANLLGSGLRLELGPLLLCFVALVIVQSLFTRYKTIYMADMMQTAVDRVRMQLFRGIGLARWRFVAQSRGSDLNHAVTTDVDRIQGAIYSLLLLVQNVVILGIFGIVSLLISLRMTLFAVAVGGVVLAFLYPIRRRSLLYGETLTEARRQQHRTTSEFITGMKLAKAFNAEPVYLEQLRSTLNVLRRDTIQYTRLASTGSLGSQVTSTLAVACYIYVAFAHLHLPFAKIVVQLFLFMRLAPRFNSVQESLQQLLVSLPAFETMRAMIANCEAERESSPEEQERAPELNAAVRFDRVGMFYGEDASLPVLTDVELSIPAGRITAIIGPSGGGKSTIADLVMGLLEPNSGRVLVDDVPLSAGNRRAWRDHIAYVPQEVFLLHDTIAANLALARRDADRDEMWAALEAANAADFVRRLPAQLDTVVGDRGMRLSGGERQRIALARGLLRRPRLLILDEATSALDWQNQALIARSIEQLRGAMTIITIAHRPSMIAFADWVVTVEGGRVVEMGDYQDLIARQDSRLRDLVQGENTAPADSAISA